MGGADLGFPEEDRLAYTHPDEANAGGKEAALLFLKFTASRTNGMRSGGDGATSGGECAKSRLLAEAVIAVISFGRKIIRRGVKR